MLAPLVEVEDVGVVGYGEVVVVAAEGELAVVVDLEFVLIVRLWLCAAQFVYILWGFKNCQF